MKTWSITIIGLLIMVAGHYAPSTAAIILGAVLVIAEKLHSSERRQ